MFAFLLETEWWNYPGFELWRFVNLMIFIGGALLLHRKFGAPVSAALRARRASIRAELEKAKLEKERATAELQKVEARVGQLDNDVAKIQAEAAAEVAAERDRIKRMTEAEVAKLKAQAQRDIANLAKSAQVELRRFTAAQSVQLAETMIRRDLNSEVDSRLIGLSAEQFRGKQN